MHRDLAIAPFRRGKAHGQLIGAPDLRLDLALQGMPDRAGKGQAEVMEVGQEVGGRDGVGSFATGRMV